MSMRHIITEKLKSHLVPSHIEVVDESAQHIGHANAPQGGESHFRLHIVSKRFSHLSRLERQRLIHDILSTELTNSIHALSIHAIAPEETD